MVADYLSCALLILIIFVDNVDRFHLESVLCTNAHPVDDL